MQNCKSAAKRIPGFRLVWRGMLRLRETAAFIVWCLRGKRPNDAYSFYKRHRLVREGEQYDCWTLVETGTYMGDTIEACRRVFREVRSVELSPEYHRRAKKRFCKVPNVKLWQGDSGSVMSEMLQDLDGRAIFWLDGHYSGGDTARGPFDCPLIAELTSIAQSPRKDHLILIDDARHFGTEPTYPTMDVVRHLLLEINPKYLVTVEDDCIIARPQICEGVIGSSNKQIAA